MEKLVIIDGNAIIHRAYHGIPPLTTKDGVMVNAVYGFVSMLLKVIHDIKPTYIAATFDMTGGSKARLEKFANYKGTRVKADQALYDQIPLVHQVVEVLGIRIFEKSGYEADDVIGTVVKMNKEQGTRNKIETLIVTGDMDTLQLVDENVKVYTLRKGLNDVVIYDAKAVKERFGFGPDMMVDYKAIRGDTSDNIPGVPGIGEVGATDLIVKVGGIDAVYKKIDTLKKLGFKDGLIKKLIEGKDSAYMSRELATIDCEVPDINFKLEETRLKPFDHEKIAPLFQKFEFVSLMKRLGGAGTTVNSKQTTEGSKTKNATKGTKAKSFFKEITVSEELDELFAKIKNEKKYGAKIITSSKDVLTAKITGVIFVVSGESFYVTGKLLEKALVIFSELDVELIGHDLKQLIKIAAVHLGVKNFQPQQGGAKNHLFDVMVASYLINPGSRAHDAASIVLKELGTELPSQTNQESLFGHDPKLLANELVLIVQAAELLRAQLISADNLGLLQKIEMPLIAVLANMENNGVLLDQDKMKELSVRVHKNIDTVTKKIYEYAGEEFNIASPIQLRDILFEKLEIPVDGIKKGKTGLSTSAEQLEKMRGLHPIIEEIENYRELAKLQNTYIDVLPAMVHPTTRRIHTNYSQVIAATGRLSSIDPNLQNIPIRTELGREIREAFVADKGSVLVSADYSQIELRVVASLAQDEKMMEIFEKGLDIHTATAAAIHGIPLEKVTKEIRRTAKEINFGILYGMGTHGLSWRAGISYADAKAFIEKYFEQFSGVKKYLDQTIVFTKKEGYCETLFGRRRYIPELNSTNYQLRAAAERMAVNHPIQGTAADLMKLGMIAVYDSLQTTSYKLQAKMLLQVHDELVLEVPEDQADAVGQMVKEKMESVAKLRVPIEVHVAKGKNWGEMK